MDIMDMGSKIKAIRNDHGISQEQLAKELHVTRQTVSNWENNKNYPDFTTLVKISEIFDVSLDILVKDDRNYIKKQKTIEKKFITRKRWIIILLLTVIILAGACLFIYNLGQGTDNAKRITSTTNVMMTVDLYDASLSRAITKTFDADEFNSMSDSHKERVLKEVCGKIEGDIPAVHLGKSTSRINLDFRTTDYYDITPHITDIELYTANGMPPKPEKRTDREVKYNDDNGVVTLDVMDFVKSEELAVSDNNSSVSEEEQISECIFLIRYEWGGAEYVSVTAVSILSTTDWSETKAQNILKEVSHFDEDIQASELEIVAQDLKGETHAVAYRTKNKDFLVAAITEEEGKYLVDYGEVIESEIPDYYEMTYYDYKRSKYNVVVFFNGEIKDISVEIVYEDSTLGSEKYTYNLSEQDRETPAVFILDPAVKDGNFSINIETL